jgi:hypothetical protein
VLLLQLPALLELLGAVCAAQPAAGQDSKPDSKPDSELDGKPDSKPPQQAKHASVKVTSTGAVTPGLMCMLVLGSWCTQPAQVFSRNVAVQQLCAHFGSVCRDLLVAIKSQQVCGRTKGSNKNGHSASLPYPGPDGWTEAYAAARMAAVSKQYMYKQREVQHKLCVMQAWQHGPGRLQLLLAMLSWWQQWLLCCLRSQMP